MILRILSILLYRSLDVSLARVSVLSIIGLLGHGHSQDFLDGIATAIAAHLDETSWMESLRRLQLIWTRPRVLVVWDAKVDICNLGYSSSFYIFLIINHLLSEIHLS